MPDSTEPDTQTLSIRKPTVADASHIWKLVSDSGVLDENSCYLYMLLCRDFAETCVVAEADSRIVGFVTAYRPPATPDVLFVWQVGVCPSMRRRGLALRMLQDLATRCPVSRHSYIEATVAPSNLASRKLFHSLAKHLGVELTECEGFSASDFLFGDHESEPLLRLGPLDGSKAPADSTSSQEKE